MPAVKQSEARSDAAVELDPGPQKSAVDAALQAWRRKATDIVLAVVVAAHLPVIVLGILGHGPPMGPLLKRVGIAVYLVVTAAAFFRRLEYRARLLVSFFVVYPALAIVTLVFPQGPYAQLGALCLPIFALVLLGAHAARMAILVSACIVVSVPMLLVQPGVVQTVGIDPAQMADPPGLAWFRTSVKVACLLGLMVLLDRFHSFLSDALAQRIAAQRKMEREMRERQRLEREIASVGDGERRRLGQELHDGVCQQVTAALLRCQALERRLVRGETVSQTDFAPLSSLLAETIDDAHNVARGLCPLDSESDALGPALRALTKRMQEMTSLRCEFLEAGEVHVPDPEAAQHLYRIAQEALSNAVRHAKSSRVAVDLRANGGELTLQVEDDGAGLPAPLPVGGMGLRIMAYRAQIMNGHLTITPVHGGGTRVTCRVPLPAGQPAAGHHA